MTDEKIKWKEDGKSVYFSRGDIQVMCIHKDSTLEVIGHTYGHIHSHLKGLWIPSSEQQAIKRWLREAGHRKLK